MGQPGLIAVIVADDLTGAMDAAAPFAKRGLRVCVLPTPDTLEAALLHSPEVLSISTTSRHATPECAAAIIGQLFELLAPLRPRILFKKIDSTLRGNLIVETAAALKASERSHLLFCPAVPTQGRTFSGGRLYLNGVPLEATAIGRDLRSAPPKGRLADLFRQVFPQADISAGSTVCTSAEATPLQPQIQLLDAETQEQLRSIAQTTTPLQDSALFVGAAGLAEALAETHSGTTPVMSPGPCSEGIGLFVVGSRTPESAEQVQRLITKHPAAYVLELADDRPLDFAEAPSLLPASQLSKIIVLKAPPKPPVDPLDPDRVAAALAATTAKILERVKISFLCVTGGDTVFSLLDELKTERIDVCGEIQPGIVYGRIYSSAGSLTLVTKAGGFGDSKVFCTVESYFSLAAETATTPNELR
ncbi:MAG: hypothetical protein C0619_12175 [Desulfuromonas sp.]|nr:MAG: hypothetical protein C0619_12175 [Desulfuromonas sp.]